METRGERRERLRKKKRAHKTQGRSVKLLWALTVERARRLTEKVRGVRHSVCLSGVWCAR